MTIFPKIIQLMKDRGMEDVLLFGGGIIPRQDIQELKKLGVGEIFTSGTSTEEIIRYLFDWKQQKKTDPTLFI
jgi:methylmalonyl-CoA mutase C-terminal domain/subunit